MRHVVLMIISALIFLSKVTFAQRSIAKNYTVEDGLPSNRIYNVIQDRKGFLWFATDNGVSRFDGKIFKNYSANDGLPDNDIIAIEEDYMGKIWFSCFNGSVAYFYQNEIHSSTNNKLLSQLRGNGYLRFLRFNEKLIFTHDAGPNGYELNAEGKLKALPNKYRAGTLMKIGNKLITAEIDRHHNLFLINDQYENLDSLIIKKSSSLYGKILSFMVMDDNKFVITSAHGILYQYEIKQNKIQFIDSIQTTFPINRIYKFKDTCWASCVDNNLYPLSNDFVIDTSFKLTLPNCTAKYSFCDKEGNYWICSEGCGVFLFPNNRFSYYRKNDGLYSNSISNIARYENEIYLSYTNNLVQSLYSKKIYKPTKAILSREVKNTCLLAFKNFVMTGGIEPIIIYNKKNGKELSLEAFGNIKCSYKYDEHNFFVGNSARCYKIELPNKIIDTIFKGRTTAVYPRKNGTVLIGTLNHAKSNLSVFTKNKQNKEWKSDSGKTYPMLRGITISCIEEVGEVLIIGTVEKGMLLLKDTNLVQLNLEKNSPNINCRKIIVDKEQNIWLASYSGIYKVSLGRTINDYEVQKIKKENGLLSDYISDILLVGDSVFVASSEGLTLFSKNNWDKGNTPPDIWINEIKINGKAQSISHMDIQLPYDSNSVDFNFSAIDFKSIGNIQFSYRLKGLNDEWQFTKQNSVRYESLSPGIYSFEVKAKNAFGNWSLGVQKYTFEIQAPWWQRNWFRAICFVSGSILLFVFLKKILSIRHQKELESLLQKKQVTELELRAIKAQINPHFLFNALNSIQCFINDGNNELADEYLSRLANLLRETLEFSSKTEVSIAEEVDFLENYLSLEKLRFDEHFTYSINCEPKPYIYNVPIPPMVLQPHIENALRHGLKQKQGQSKLLSIKMRLVDKQLICEIEDNGVGRKKSAEFKKIQYKNYTSKGTLLSESKLNMYAQLTGRIVSTEIIDLYEDEHSKLARGTIVRIIINQ